MYSNDDGDDDEDDACLWGLNLKRAGNCNKGGKFDQGCSQSGLPIMLLRG